MNLESNIQNLALSGSSSDKQIDDLITKALIDFDFDIRDYQFEIVAESIKCLNYRTNILISLPPGTGKTIIGQIIAQKYLVQSLQGGKILFLLPNNNLLTQHYDYSSWLHHNKLCKSISLNSDWKNNKRIDHSYDLKNHDFLFALPRLFFNLYNEDYITIDIIKKIKLIIVDEYDSFSKSIINDFFSDSIDFKKDFFNFSKIPFDFKTRFIFMSATPNIDDCIIENKKKKEKSIWSKIYNPKLIQIDKSKYTEYIPIAFVIPIGCASYYVYENDNIITQKISKIYIEIFAYLFAAVHDQDIIVKLISDYSGDSAPPFRRNRRHLKVGGFV